MAPEGANPGRSRTPQVPHLDRPLKHGNVLKLPPRCLAALPLQTANVKLFAISRQLHCTEAHWHCSHRVAAVHDACHAMN